MFGRLSPVVKNLLILNIGIYVIEMLTQVPVRGGTVSTLIIYGGLYDIASADFQPYQILTHMFLHWDFMHILYNMLGLLFMGPILEQTVGQKKFLLLYMVCGFGAAALQLTYYYFTGTQGLMAGASGATMGVIIGTALFYPNIEVNVYFLFPVKMKYVALFLVGMDLFNGLSGSNTGIAHFAHLGGVLFAILLIMFWKRKGEFY